VCFITKLQISTIKDSLVDLRRNIFELVVPKGKYTCFEGSIGFLVKEKNRSVN
jgi:hypothetical protein